MCETHLIKKCKLQMHNFCLHGQEFLGVYYVIYVFMCMDVCAYVSPGYVSASILVCISGCVCGLLPRVTSKLMSRNEKKFFWYD